MIETVTAQATAPTLIARAAMAQDSCLHRPVAAASPRYGWPLKPFHRQHPVRGYFGDPRIGKGPNDTISRSFHFGVDISAPDGTAVYATVTGIARVNQRYKNTVSIRPGDGSAFAYWHIVPAVEHGQHVVAYRTVIGHIANRWGHVHFAEWRGRGYVNPLRPGAMGPYTDRTCPAATTVSF
jgi:murein DD-endopeptidase MepM/ murein hydrolase activator NlpD